MHAESLQLRVLIGKFKCCNAFSVSVQYLFIDGASTVFQLIVLGICFGESYTLVAGSRLITMFDDTGRWSDPRKEF